MKQIKVLHIANMNKGSGIASFLMNYFRHIDRSIVLFDFLSDNLSGDTYYEEEINALGGTLYKAPRYKKNLFRYIKYIDKIIKTGYYDIVHCHEFVLSLVALLIAKKNNIRHSHSHSHINIQNSVFISIIKRITVVFSRPLFRILSSNCFACSIDAGKYLFGNHSTFEVIHNAISVEKYVFNLHAREQVRRDLRISGDTLLLGYVARFDKQKNHDFLIKIFSKLLEKRNDSILLLIGQGPTQENIRDMANIYGVNEKVIFYGITDNAADLYSAMDVFVFPSFGEGLPLVGIEAQCSGLPVIASKNIPEEMQVSDLVVWLGLDESPERWADEIIKYFLHTGRKDMSEIITSAGYNIIVESKKLEQRYIDLINSESN